MLLIAALVIPVPGFSAEEIEADMPAAEGVQEEAAAYNAQDKETVPEEPGADSGAEENGASEVSGEAASAKDAEPSSSGSVRMPAEESEENADSEQEPLITPDNSSGIAVPEPAPKKALSSFTISDPVRLSNSSGKHYNLRSYLGEGRQGYAIVEGSCTDGTYSYHCLINGSTDWGRLVKVRMSDGRCMAVSEPYNFSHGNGMCYDSMRNRLVVASYSNGRRTVTIVDPDNLNDITQKTISFKDYGTRLSEAGFGSKLGLTAIAYNKRFDCYIGMQKADHNIFIIDAETLAVKAVAITRFDSSITGTYQSIDADDTYVYFLLSRTNGTGIMAAFDWNSEKLAALISGDSAEDIWLCGNGDGRCSAIIKVKGVNEIESMYHVDTDGGRARFYLVNYNNDPKYKTVKYKVKWKKVKKKIKVKWKRVKKRVKWKKVKSKSGKWKWKYKTKKVWKYKTKTKKVWKYKTKKKKVLNYYNRDSHILDIGEF